MSNDERTMVERKLSDVYTSVTFDIPWSWFEHGVRCIKEQLENRGLNYTMDELVNHPKVIADFQDSLSQSYNDQHWSWLSDYSPDADDIFSKEIADLLFQKELENNADLQELVAKHGPEMELSIPTHKYQEAIKALKLWKII